jgi:hypothetical protein
LHFHSLSEVNPLLDNMKKDIQKRLTSYSKLAGAAVALTPLAVNGEIVYTDVDPDVTLANGEAFEIDFNDDGIIDMVVGMGTATGTTGGDPVYFQAAFASGSGAGSFAGTVQSFGAPFYFPEAYNAGASINSGLSWQSPSAFGSLNYLTSVGGAPVYSGGNWENQTDKYLAVRFTLGTVQHYGWVRMSAGVAGPSNFLTVSGYAFEAVPDEGIEAGAETGGIVPSGITVPDYSDQFNCYSFGHSIFVQSLDQTLQNGTVEVFNLSGQQVFAGIMSQGATIINIDGAEGLYFLRLQVADGYAERKLYLSGN